MQLYFSPLACSMATRISLYEAGVSATYTEVDPVTKRTLDEGKDFLAVNPLGYVPALRADDGRVLTENAAILQHVAETLPQAKLAPTDGRARTQLQQWLSFIGTELHKGIFSVVFDRKAPDAAKAHALEKGRSRLDWLEKQLAGRTYLLDDFSVADAYLVTVLTWTAATPLDLSKWPALHAYLHRLRERPSVAKAFAEERALYVKEKQRHGEA